jgi:hypothetical protein
MHVSTVCRHGEQHVHRFPFLFIYSGILSHEDTLIHVIRIHRYQPRFVPIEDDFSRWTVIRQPPCKSQLSALSSRPHQLVYEVDVTQFAKAAYCDVSARGIRKELAAVTDR